MVINDLFIADKDTDTHRVCGSCGELKPVTAFYKDGKDHNGKTRYRRDCRECYKHARMAETIRKGGK